MLIKVEQLNSFYSKGREKKDRRGGIVQTATSVLCTKERIENDEMMSHKSEQMDNYRKLLTGFLTRTAVQVIHYASAADFCVPGFAYFRLALNTLCHPVTLAYLFLSPADFDVACNLVQSIRIFRSKPSVN